MPLGLSHYRLSSHLDTSELYVLCDTMITALGFHIPPFCLLQCREEEDIRRQAWDKKFSIQKIQLSRVNCVFSCSSTSQGRNQVYYKEGITNKHVDSDLAWSLAKLPQVSTETGEEACMN